MAASDARPVPRKNTAFRFYFAIRKPSDSTLITTWAGQDSEVSLDGGSFADCTNEATEIGTTGCGYIDLTAAEMNADAVVLKVTVTNTGAVPLVFTLFPEEAGDYRLSDTQKVDVETIKTQTLTAAAGITFPSSIASPTNITAATGVTLAAVTHTGAVIPTVSAVTGLTASNLDVATSTLATAANLAIVASYLDTEIAAIKAKTDQLTFTTANKVDSTAVLDSAVTTKIDNIQDAAGWLLAISSGAVANPQTSTEQYDITQFGVNYRVAMAGLTSTGTRTAPTLSKP